MPRNTYPSDYVVVYLVVESKQESARPSADVVLYPRRPEAEVRVPEHLLGTAENNPWSE